MYPSVATVASSTQEAGDLRKVHTCAEGWASNSSPLPCLLQGRGEGPEGRSERHNEVADHLGLLFEESSPSGATCHTQEISENCLVSYSGNGLWLRDHSMEGWAGGGMRKEGKTLQEASGALSPGLKPAPRILDV